MVEDSGKKWYDYYMSLCVKETMAVTLPNILTTVRLALVPVFSALFYSGHPRYALGAYIAACLTDVLDGYLARRMHQVTAFGKLMDPLADKVMQLAMLFCLALNGHLGWWVPAIMAAKEIFMVIGGTMLLKKRNVVVISNWSGKAATVLWVLAVLMVYPWHDSQLIYQIGDWLVYGSIGFSFFAMVNYIKIYVKKQSDVKAH